MIIDALLDTACPEDSVIIVGSRFLDNPPAIAPEAGCILMLEPDPARARGLQFYAGLQDNFQLIEAGLAAQSGQATYHRFNVPGLDGFIGVSALKPAFADLQEIASFPADRLSVGALAERLPEPHRGQDVLIVDLVGQEGDILPALEASGVLARLSRIVLRSVPSAPGPQVEDTPVDTWLADRLFDRVLEVPSADPDMSVRILIRNPLGKRLSDLSEAVAAAQTQVKDTQARRAEAETNAKGRIEALQKKLAEAEATAQKLREEQGKSEAATRAQVKDLQARLANANKTLETERQDTQARRAEAETNAKGRIEALQKKLAEAEATAQKLREEQGKSEAATRAQVKDLQARLANANKTLETERQDTQARRAEAETNAKGRIEALQKKLAEAEATAQKLREEQGKSEAATRAQVKDLQARLANANKTLETERQDTQARRAEAEANAKGRIEALQKKLAEAEATAQKLREEQGAGRRDLSIALRMQALREADLKDLRERFTTLVDEKTEQDHLLRKLTLRLDSAARYLDQIESLPEALPPQEVLTAPGGKASGKKAGKTGARPARKKRKARG